jgi:hypothetical protein
MSSPAHRIRLRRPWLCQVHAGRALWTRRFGRPTNLPADERVWLLLKGFPPDTSARLNGRPIPSCACDVTDLLQARNALILETIPPVVAGVEPLEDPPGRVVLEFRQGSAPA